MFVIPQGVAYAALAGMPLVTGIYASFLPALVGVLWSASARLSVGPTALTSLDAITAEQIKDSLDGYLWKKIKRSPVIMPIIIDA